MALEDTLLKDFVKELHGVLKEFKGNRLIDAETKGHQLELEKLIDTTNRILDKKALKVEVDNFDRMVQKTEASFETLKAAHKDDVKFQKQWVKAFGTTKKDGATVGRVMKTLNTSVVGLAAAVKQISIAQDAASTASSFLTGGIGGEVFRNIAEVAGQVKAGVEKFKNYRQGRRDKLADRFEAAEPSLSGMFHSGITSVPREGSYLLDGGERVLSQEQNQDLMGFINGGMTVGSEANRIVRVVTEGVGGNYFDPLQTTLWDISDSEDAIGQKRHEQLTRRLFLLNATINDNLLSSIDKFFFRREVAWKKFMRHPLLNTAALFLKPLFSTLGFIKKVLFGDDRKSETDRIVDSNREISEAILTGGIDRNNRGLKGFLNALKTGGLTRRLQEIEDRGGPRDFFDKNRKGFAKVTGFLGALRDRDDLRGGRIWGFDQQIDKKGHRRRPETEDDSPKKDDDKDSPSSITKILIGIFGRPRGGNGTFVKHTLGNVMMHIMRRTLGKSMSVGNTLLEKIVGGDKKERLQSMKMNNILKKLKRGVDQINFKMLANLALTVGLPAMIAAAIVSAFVPPAIEAVNGAVMTIQDITTQGEHESAHDYRDRQDAFVTGTTIMSGAPAGLVARAITWFSDDPDPTRGRYVSEITLPDGTRAGVIERQRSNVNPVDVGTPNTPEPISGSVIRSGSATQEVRLDDVTTQRLINGINNGGGNVPVVTQGTAPGSLPNIDDIATWGVARGFWY